MTWVKWIIGGVVALIPLVFRFFKRGELHQAEELGAKSERLKQERRAQDARDAMGRVEPLGKSDAVAELRKKGRI